MHEFGFTYSVDLKSEFKRIIFEEIDFVNRQIDDDFTADHMKVHEIRKSFKRIRSVLRLFRYSLGEKVYSQLNFFFRDLNRRLSGVRDKQILLQQAELFHSQLPGYLRTKKLSRMVDKVRNEHDDLSLVIIRISRLFNIIKDKLEQVQSKIQNLKIRGEGFELISRGLRRTYRRSQKYFSKVKAMNDPDIIHEFRKNVKYLWLEMLLLKSLCQGLPETCITIPEKISGEIGSFRDAYLFRVMLEKEPWFTLNKKQTRNMLAKARRTKAEKFDRTLEMAEKFFRESPDNFMERVICRYAN